MHCNALIITFGLTLAARTSAAPLSELVPDMRPGSTVMSSAPVSTATGMANITAGKVPDHKHTPDCEHSYNATHTTTGHDAQNMTSGGTKGPAKGYGHADRALGNPSPYPGFNASASSHPHAALAHNNHTGDYCNHPSHHNTTITDATDDKAIRPRLLNESASSSPNRTTCHCARPSHLYNSTHAHHAHLYNGTHNHSDPACAHASHHNGTGVAEHGDEKRTLVPRVDVTVCLGPDCTDTEVVTADLSSTGVLEGVHAKDGRRMAKRQDTELSYEDVARQMSGATIAGGM